ncbi:MAG: DUF1343 domain-containing protein, partial [Tannerella sp.]|nr:DUF1343 domain-containing protein [Tannerella sp.]
MTNKLLIINFLLIFISCTGQINSRNHAQNSILNGADRIEEIKDIVGNKRIGLIINQTSLLIDGSHLLDVMLDNGLNVKKIFAPEHGFRDLADAGAHVKNSIDSKTGIPIVSLYGKNRKPTAGQLANVDILIFDIQDVGTRFYTYISTMHYAMEAAAENGKEFLVLDRPNPNDFVDGPMLRKSFESFVGVHSIPLLHGLTVGELALMINSEGWIETGKNSCNLKIIEIQNWKHGDDYTLPVKPSPNLPNQQSVRLYPSLCFFEGTTISVGRGTEYPFTVIGSPDRKYGDFTFKPSSLPGFTTNPPYKDKTCYGKDLRKEEFAGGLSLKYVIEFFIKSGRDTTSFFGKRARHFDLLAGTDELRKQIVAGLTEEQIRHS